MKKKFLLLSILFFVLTFQTVNAQEIIPTLTPTPAPVQYTLPYPGILPGNPLYGVRSIRDGIVNFLISNPLKKAEYELLQADKNLQATVFLIEQKKEDKLITTTLIRAENNFERAIIKVQEAKKQGMETDKLLAKLSLANKKHQEVIAEIIKSTDGEVKKEAVKQLEKTRKLGKTVSEQAPK
jgi:hypothetical protein